MRIVIASITLVAVALTVAGCFGSSSQDEVTFDCKRGFRVSDWTARSPIRLKTGQSIVKCRWLDGRTDEQVRQLLGKPDFGPRLAPEYVLPGGRDAGENLREWMLKLRFDPHTGRLVSAEAETMPI